MVAIRQQLPFWQLKKAFDISSSFSYNHQVLVIRREDMKKQNLNNPLVSVIMPVYNAGEFLMDAIKSIKTQTYKNWELLAVNDGSKDNSWLILKRLAKKDRRIKIFNLKKNFGLGFAANFAINKAKGKFLARFDADDIMPKNRLRKQVKFLLKNPKILAVGGQCLMIDEKNRVIGKKTFPLTDEKIRKMAFVMMSLQAGSMMINRANLPEDFIFYSTNHLYFEDHELLFKLLQIGQLANLPQTMLYYRQHKYNSTKNINIKKIYFLLLKLRLEVAIKGLLPDLNGVLINLAQLLFIIILPNKAIEKFYFFLRIKNHSYNKKIKNFYYKILSKFKNRKIYIKKIYPTYS